MTGGTIGALLGFPVDGAFVTTIGCDVTGCNVTGCSVVGDSIGMIALGLSAGAAIGVKVLGAPSGPEAPPTPTTTGAATGHHALGCPGIHAGAKVLGTVGAGDSGDHVVGAGAGTAGAHVVGAGIVGAAVCGFSSRSPPEIDRGLLAKKASNKLVGIVGLGVTGTAGTLSKDAVGAAGWRYEV